MNGGAGLSYEAVGKMTQDQIFHRLCDMNLLKDKIGKRTKKIGVGSVPIDKYNKVKAIDKDGNPIILTTKGKSKAAMIREKLDSKPKKNRRRKRKK